jgi:AcrR family transcriptional regulator
MSAQASRPAPEEQLTPGARRILDVASELFYWRGIHAVGVDTIAAESGVTKRTLYDRFGSKDNLVASYLRRRDRRWRGLIEARLAATAEDEPATRVLVPFDVLPQWLAASERGCSFINAFAELPEGAHPGRQVIVAEKTWLRDLFRRLLTEAGAAADDAATTATQLLSLHEGAIVSFSVVGAAGAARAARGAVEKLVAGAVAAA